MKTTELTALSQSLLIDGMTRFAGHSYPASPENCWNADWPGASNWPLRIVCATSMPTSVTEAEPKDLSPFICRVSFLMTCDPAR
ncbi:hypothetical protein RA2_04264 [Roseovarius sp. A-2]|nr:hypothetical protein RA2_04264 [Roseovarius sp. A-2]